MAPSLALLLCCGFVAWLFREDMKWRRLESGALWIAGFWVAIVGSRSPAYWTAYLGLGGGVESNLEGSPVSFLITTVLIVAAMLVLRRQGINWSAVIQENKAFFFIYLFFALSAFWAEYPLVSLRRLFKDVGAVAVAMLLLTQLDPGAAIRTIYVRVSFILFPFSVLLYKYFPELGRTYSKGGEPLFAGVCTFKNELGQMLLVFILILVWDLLELWKQEKSDVRKRQLLIHCGCLLMGVWLLLKADSATSLLCLLLGFLVWWGGGYLARLKRPLGLVLSVVAIGLCLVAVQAIFDPKENILAALGRDENLTGRGDAWPIMVELCKDPLVGDGYRMFWDVSREEVKARTRFDFPSAHNGYLETYLAGGMVGLALLGLLLLATGLKIVKGLLGGGSFAKLGFAFWVVLLAYNWTESSFLYGNSLWFAFLLWAVKPPLGLSSAVVLPAEAQLPEWLSRPREPEWLSRPREPAADKASLRGIRANRFPSRSLDLNSLNRPLE
jgi:exopolysaccharide production protein ExoQ